MLKQEVINKILPKAAFAKPQASGAAFAPTNIALCKYWGKRNSELNLPCNSSLSLSLGDKGSFTTISFTEVDRDQVFLNGNLQAANTVIATRITEFLNQCWPQRQQFFQIDTTNNIPIAAGVASSASGFAALVKALNQFFNWQLTESSLSILARLGSGSACRSLWPGFVEWSAGTTADGMDSHGYPLTVMWPELRLGLLILASEEKKISSRVAMQQTLETSVFYDHWLIKAASDLGKIKQAIKAQHFTDFGQIAESNALAMHATTLTAWPPICFSLPSTVACMQKIWQLRQQGLAVYFTQDAGPNLQLLFLKKDELEIQNLFPDLQIIKPFEA